MKCQTNYSSSSGHKGTLGSILIFWRIFVRSLSSGNLRLSFSHALQGSYKDATNGHGVVAFLPPLKPLPVEHKSRLTLPTMHHSGGSPAAQTRIPSFCNYSRVSNSRWSYNGRRKIGHKAMMTDALTIFRARATVKCGCQAQNIA